MPNSFLGFPVPKAKIAEMIQGTAPPKEHATWHFPTGSDPIVLSSDISIGQAVGWNGTKFIGINAGGGGGIGTLYEGAGFFFNTNFSSIDGYDKYTDGQDGTVTLYQDALELVSKNSFGSYAGISKSISVPPYNTSNFLKWEYGKKFRTTIYYEYPSGNLGHVWVTLGFLNFDQEQNKHFGFFIRNRTIYSHIGDGTNFTSTPIGTIPSGAGYSYIDFEAILTASDCKFYLNSELKDTKTSPLPTGNESADSLINVSVYNWNVEITHTVMISYFISWHGLA